MRKGQEQISQLSFLPPDDAAFVNMLRRFMSEAARIYEVRAGASVADALQINQPRDVYEFFRAEMENLTQEQLRTIQLNNKSRIISSTLLYQGNINSTIIRIGEVFRDAIIDSAASIVICHNHPSGDPTPSPEDVAVTRLIAKAGKLLGIELEDHIIIGKGKFISLRQQELGFDSPKPTPRKRTQP